MALEMKDDCERCHASLTGDDTAFICSYECTFCADCAADMEEVCPSCGGELVLRPIRHSAERPA